MVGKDAKAILVGINGKQSALYLIEDVVITIHVFKAGTVFGSQRKGATNGFHFVRIYTDFVHHAAAFVCGGAPRTLMSQCRNGSDVYMDILRKSHRISALCP